MSPGAAHRIGADATGRALGRGLPGSQAHGANGDRESDQTRGNHPRPYAPRGRPYSEQHQASVSRKDLAINLDRKECPSAAIAGTAGAPGRGRIRIGFELRDLESQHTVAVLVGYEDAYRDEARVVARMHLTCDAIRDQEREIGFWNG